MKNLFWTMTLATLLTHAGSALAEDTPPARRHGGLTVTEPPAARTESARGRIASDIEGTLIANEARTWVGPSVPSFVPVGHDDLELIRLTQHDDGWLAEYRQMYGRADVPGCAAENMWDNCKQGARFYRKDGTLAWQVDFHGLFPRKDHLTVNHVLKVGDTLYYGEACQTYAKDASGKCSQLVKLDVSGETPKVVWRSKPLVTNAPILKVGRFLVTGYGFTAEKDRLMVVDPESGRVIYTKVVAKAPEELTLSGKTLSVLIYGADEPIRFELVGFDEGTRGKPRLVPIDR